MPNPESKRIICLANSRRQGGCCIAGKEILSDGSVGEWIRPVSNGLTEAVSRAESRYKDGGEPRVLDVVEIPLKNASPSGFQQENWLLDPNPDHPWEKIGSWDDLPDLADNPTALWINGCSTVNGENDRIPISITDSIESSLYFIRLPALELSVFAPGAAFRNPRRRVQGRFQYGGANYWIWVTDPRYEEEYLQKPNGDYHIGECFLTVSLADGDDGYAYKLIAAIIEPQ